MSKLLIACPTCEKLGIRNVLGELQPGGMFVVMRFNKSGQGFTKIGGNDFFVICDRCNEQVYFKKLERRDDGTIENSLLGQSWILRGSIGAEIGTKGTGSITA